MNAIDFEREFGPRAKKKGRGGDALIVGSIALLRLSAAEMARDEQKKKDAEALCEEYGVIGKEC